MSRLILTACLIASLGVGAFFILVDRPAETPLPVTQPPALKQADYKIGLLGFSELTSAVFSGFKERVEEISREKKFSVEYLELHIPYTTINVDRAVEYLLEEHVDLIVTGQSEVPAIIERTRTVPVISALSNDPVGVGLAKSESGSNTNVAFIKSGTVETASRRLELFLELSPQAKRILVPRGATTIKGNAIGPIESLRQTATQHGVKLLINEFETRRDLNKFFIDIDPTTFDAIYRFPDGFSAANNDVIFGFASQLKKPAIALSSYGLERGGVMAYGPSYEELGRMAADIASKILVDKTPPGEIPIVNPSHFLFGLNERAAKSLGIQIPDNLHRQADYFIQ